MYGQVNESGTQRKKLIIVSAVMGIIILVLAVILVNAIINKNKKPASEIASEGVIASDEEPSENAEVSRAESTNASDSSESSNNNSAASENASESAAKEKNLNPVSNETDGSKSLPSTGPREVLSLALLLGSCAAFLASKLYLKELA